MKCCSMEFLATITSSIDTCSQLTQTRYPVVASDKRHRERDSPVESRTIFSDKVTFGDKYTG